MDALKATRAITVIIILAVAGLWFKSFSAQITPTVLTELPFEIEKNNPVPEVRHWNKDGKTYYYFNWGVKSTTGYSLKVDRVKGNIIRLKALTPEPEVLVAQILTYPYLYISLPEGNYKVEVIDREGNIMKDFFKAKNNPLKMTVYLPQGRKIAERVILRDPYLGNEGKTTVQIALEALFSQKELKDFVNVGVKVIGASFKENKWFVLFSKSFDNLTEDNKRPLTEIINKTILALKTEHLNSVIITTNPAEMPELKN